MSKKCLFPGRTFIALDTQSWRVNANWYTRHISRSPHPSKHCRVSQGISLSFIPSFAEWAFPSNLSHNLNISSSKWHSLGTESGIEPHPVPFHIILTFSPIAIFSSIAVMDSQYFTWEKPACFLIAVFQHLSRQFACNKQMFIEWMNEQIKMQLPKNATVYVGVNK